MKAIINVNEIKKSLNGKEINAETIANAITSNSYETIFDYSKEGNTEVNEFFADIYTDQKIYVHSNLVQSFIIQNEENGIEYHVAINENYVDSGSVDYCYSFTINY